MVSWPAERLVTRELLTPFWNQLGWWYSVLQLVRISVDLVLLRSFCIVYLQGLLLRNSPCPLAGMQQLSWLLSLAFYLHFKSIFQKQIQTLSVQTAQEAFLADLKVHFSRTVRSSYCSRFARCLKCNIEMVWYLGILHVQY